MWNIKTFSLSKNKRKEIRNIKDSKKYKTKLNYRGIISGASELFKCVVNIGVLCGCTYSIWLNLIKFIESV